jgi:hypothetical protein
MYSAHLSYAWFTSLTTNSWTDDVPFHLISAMEFGVDREVLNEAYEQQHLVNVRSHSRYIVIMLQT